MGEDNISIEYKNLEKKLEALTTMIEGQNKKLVELPSLILYQMSCTTNMMNLKSQIIEIVMSLYVSKSGYMLKGPSIDVYETDRVRKKILQFLNRTYDVGVVDKLLSIAQINKNSLGNIEDEIDSLSSWSQDNTSYENRQENNYNNSYNYQSSYKENNKVEKPPLKHSVYVYWNRDTEFAVTDLFDENRFILNRLTSDNIPSKSILFGLETARQSPEKIQEWISNIPVFTKEVLVIFLYSNSSLKCEDLVKKNIQNLCENVSFYSDKFIPDVPNKLLDKKAIMTEILSWIAK